MKLRVLRISTDTPPPYSDNQASKPVTSQTTAGVGTHTLTNLVGNVMKTVHTDVAIIGAGSAGLSAYRAAKAEGAAALLIEGGAYGTTCARVGCMPSKLLIAAAEAAHDAARTAPFGVHVDGAIRIDGRAVMQRLKSERDRFVGFVVDGVEAMPADDRLIGHARFIDDGLLQVGDHTLVHAKRVVIATGSAPDMPEMFAALGDRAIVNDDVFAWSDLPKSVAVVGAGVIGLELGQALSRLGVRVSVLGARGHVGPLTDPAIRDYAHHIFADEFHFEPRAEVLAATRDGDAVHLRYRSTAGELVEDTFDYVLVATGRKPNLAGLALNNTSLELDRRGMPVYDARTLQAGRHPVFIAGDANGVLPLLHEAADEGRSAGSNAARFPDSHAPRAPRAARDRVHGPGHRDGRRKACGSGGGFVRRRRGELRRPGTQPRHAAQPRPDARLRRPGEPAVRRRGVDRAGRRAHRASACLGAADEPDRRRDAGDAVLSPGDRGRLAHRVARCRQAVAGRGDRKPCASCLDETRRRAGCCRSVSEPSFNTTR